MDFFSSYFILFFLGFLLLYYLFAPAYRKKIIFISSIMFWATQSYLLITLLIICFLLDFYFFQLLKNDKFNKSHLFISFLLYIGLILFYFLAPLSESFRTAGLYPFIKSYDHLPVGIFIIAFQSIRNLVIFYRKPFLIENFTYFKWFNMQLFFPSFFCGPINTYDYFLKQKGEEIRFNLDKFIIGIKLFFWALLKKLVIVDRLQWFMTSYAGSSFQIGGGWDVVLVIFIPFFYVTFLVGAYYSFGRSISFLLGFEPHRNVDIYAYLTGIGNFWSRWLVTLKQTFDEFFEDSKHCKLISYSLILLLNITIFCKSYLGLVFLPLFAALIYLDFYIQERNYWNISLFSSTIKIFSYLLIALFWSILFSSGKIILNLTGEFNTLRSFNNSDFLIFIIILLVVILHIVRRKFFLVKMKRGDQLEDISLVGIAFLGYFVMMFGVF